MQTQTHNEIRQAESSKKTNLERNNSRKKKTLKQQELWWKGTKKL